MLWYLSLFLASYAIATKSVEFSLGNSTYMIKFVLKYTMLGKSYCDVTPPNGKLPEPRIR